MSVEESVEEKLEKFLEGIKGTICFRERMKIYAPTCHGGCEDVVEKLIREISKVMKGCTVYDAEKYWVSVDGYVVSEPVRVIEIPHYCLTREEAEAIVRAVAEYMREANQEALAIHESNFYIAPVPELLEHTRNESKENQKADDVGVDLPEDIKKLLVELRRRGYKPDVVVIEETGDTCHVWKEGKYYIGILPKDDVYKARNLIVCGDIMCAVFVGGVLRYGWERDVEKLHESEEW